VRNVLITYVSATFKHVHGYRNIGFQVRHTVTTVDINMILNGIAST